MPQSSHTDDLTIHDDALLWRLVGPDWWKVDEHSGALVVTTQAFQSRRESEAMSFFLAEVVQESGRTAKELVADKPGYGVVELTVASVRELGLPVVRDATDSEPAHVLVPGKKTGRIKRLLREASKWTVYPEPW